MWSAHARVADGVDEARFYEVSAEFAALAGEGDRSLAFWRKVHTAHFTRERERVGRTFSGGMLVACERFHVATSPAHS